MPDKGEEENDQQVSNQPCSVADIDQADSTKLHSTKGVSWQDCVDGKSLFTVSRPIHVAHDLWCLRPHLDSAYAHTNRMPYIHALEHCWHLPSVTITSTCLDELALIELC